MWSSGSQTRHQHLSLIVPPTPGISLWITTKMGVYCLLAYPVLHKGPSLNLRGEVWTLRHSAICVNTWMISFGLSDAGIFPSWASWRLGVNGFLSPQSRTPLSWVCLSVNTSQSKTRRLWIKTLCPAFSLSATLLFFVTPRCIVRTVRHLVWW